MIRVALKGLLGAQAPRRADRARDRPRRRDGQRQLHPHRHDQEELRHDLRRLVRARRRGRQLARRRSTSGERDAERRRSPPTCSRDGAAAARRRTSPPGSSSEATARRRGRQADRQLAAALAPGRRRRADAAPQPAQARRGRVAARRGEIAIDEATAEKSDLAVGDTIGVVADGPVAALPHHRDRRFGSRRLARRRNDRRLRPADGAAAARQAGQARRDPVARDRTASRPAELVAQIRPLLPPTAQVESADGAGGGGLDGDAASSTILRTFLLAFGGIALFVGALRDLQHAGDHRRAAHAGVRHAADARRLPRGRCSARWSSRRS